MTVKFDGLTIHNVCIEEERDSDKADRPSLDTTKSSAGKSPSLTV